MATDRATGQVGSGRTGRVGVHEGDDFRVLARQPAVKGENRREVMEKKHADIGDVDIYIYTHIYI